MPQYVRQIISLMSPRRRWQMLVIFVLAIINSALEALGVSSIAPLMMILVNPTAVAENSILSNIILKLAIPEGRLVPLMLGYVAVIFVFKSAFHLLCVWVQQYVVRKAEVEAATRIMALYLEQDYSFHARRNSAELMRNLNEALPPVFNAMAISTMRLLTEILVVTSLLLILLQFSPAITLLSVALLCGTLGGVYTSLRSRYFAWSAAKIALYEERLLWQQQSLGCAKEIKVYNLQGYFANRYREVLEQIAVLMTRTNFASEFPRLATELAMILAVILLIMIEKGQPPADIVAILGAFAAAGMRLMPSATRIMAALEGIRSSRPALERIYPDFSLPSPALPSSDTGTLTFREAIEIENLTLRYDGYERAAVDGVSLRIVRGSHVGFVGTSGAGKSSLIDMLMGVILPSSGRILVDGRDVVEDLPGWQRYLGYVPQTVSILDDSLRRNVAFGIRASDIEDRAIWRALELAKLDDFARTLPAGLDEPLGERGARMSGGQRQRVGIARALYRNPEVLVFDEATSALDNETEKAITDTIFSLRGQKTVLVIAHRLSTLKDCDRIVHMEAGRVAGQGSFEQLCRQCPGFARMVELAEMSSSESLDDLAGYTGQPLK